MAKYVDANALLMTIAEFDYLLTDSHNSTDYGMFTNGIQQAISEQTSIVTDISSARLQELCAAEQDKRIIEMPPDGQIYHIEKIEETGECWIGNKPCQYILSDGYYCGWGVVAICFPFSELGKTFFLTRDAAQAILERKE